MAFEEDEDILKEIDVVSCSPTPSMVIIDFPEEAEPNEAACEMNEDEKQYFCQRCLNHSLLFPRKGHKPNCRYLDCPCEFCNMVETRRQLNNMLSKEKASTEPRGVKKGPRVRDPQCARCGAHGVKIPLRGHKRSTCPFLNCACTLCKLVENRRTLMAKQIKLRRNQQKNRGNIKPRIKKVAAPRCRSTSDSVGSPVSDMAFSPSSPLLASPNNQFNSVSTSTASPPMQIIPQLFLPSPQQQINPPSLYNLMAPPMPNPMFAPNPPIGNINLHQYNLILQLLAASRLQ